MTRTPRALRMLTLCVWPLLQPCTANADAVLDWNIVSLKTTAAAAFNPPLESRNLAIVHAAMFDAVNSILREFHPYAVSLDAPRGTSAEAAVAAAAHFALVQLYPDQRTAVDAAYADVVQKGLTVSRPPKAEPWGVREFHLRHPDGHTFRVGAGLPCQ